MNRTFLAVVAAALVFIVPAAQAETEGLYGGIDYIMFDYDEVGVEEVNPSAISFKLGSRVTKNFAVEARLGVGLADDSVTILGIDVDLDVDNFIGLYAKGIAPLSDTFEVYGMVGFTRAELTASAMGLSISGNDSDFSYGVGANIAFSEAVSGNLEYAKLLSESDYDLIALSIGLEYKF